jgi:hypothetical protein
MYYEADDFDITIKEITYNKFADKVYTVIFEAEYNYFGWDDKEKHNQADRNIFEFKNESLTIDEIKEECAKRMAKMLTD